MKIFLFAFLLLAMLTGVARAQASVRNGDTIDIRLSGVPSEETATFNASYTVDDKGMINLPYINEIKVEGLLPNQIQDVIQNKLKEEKIYTKPTITVQTQSQARYVNVDGEVKSVQRVAFTADMTLMSAINACGGFSDYANQKKVTLTRGGSVTTYDCREIRKNPSSDPKVLPGDQIHVPQSWF
jgi:protein involved in polysaccharide export with SLBB domain